MKLTAITAIPAGREAAGQRTRQSLQAAAQYCQGPFSGFAWAYAPGKEGDEKSLCDLWNEARDEALKDGADWFMVLPAGALVDVECFGKITPELLHGNGLIYGLPWTREGPLRPDWTEVDLARLDAAPATDSRWTTGCYFASQFALRSSGFGEDYEIQPEQGLLIEAFGVCESAQVGHRLAIEERAPEPGP